MLSQRVDGAYLKDMGEVVYTSIDDPKAATALESLTTAWTVTFP